MVAVTRLTGLEILLIEDDYYLADDTHQILTAAGARVAGPYARAAEGLARIAQGALDCAVLDVNLGEGPSFVTAQALRLSRVPFVFVTGYGREVLPAEFGAAQLLEKPVEGRALVDAVARACCKTVTAGS